MMESMKFSDRIAGLGRWNDHFETVYGGVLDVFGKAKKVKLVKCQMGETLEFPQRAKQKWYVTLLKMTVWIGSFLTVPLISFIVKKGIEKLNNVRIIQARANHKYLLNKSLEASQSSISTKKKESSKTRSISTAKSESSQSSVENSLEKDKIRDLNRGDKSLKDLGFRSFDKSLKDYLEKNKGLITRLDLSCYGEELKCSDLRFIVLKFISENLKYLHVSSSQINPGSLSQVVFLENLKYLKLTNCLVDFNEFRLNKKNWNLMKENLIELDLSRSTVRMEKESRPFIDKDQNINFVEKDRKPLSRRLSGMIENELSNLKVIKEQVLGMRKKPHWGRCR